MPKKISVCHVIAAWTLCLFSGTTFAQKPANKPAEKLFVPVTVSEVWAKTTVPGSAVSAAYMHIKSTKSVKLLKVESAMAGMVEIHSMKMDGGVMEMSAVDAVNVPANKVVELKPGSFHVMLMKVKRPISDGDKVPLTLTFEGADKKPFKINVEATGQAKAKPSPVH